MKNLLSGFAILIILPILSCSKPTLSKECGTDIIENEDQYKTAIKQTNTILGHKIEGNCLTITISAGGCDGSSWETNLTSSKQITESYPTKRNIAISLKNDELCEAYIMKDFTFDLSKIKNIGTTHLILKDYDTIIEFK